MRAPIPIKRTRVSISSMINLFRFYLRRGNEFKLMDLRQIEVRERIRQERNEGWKVEHVVHV